MSDKQKQPEKKFTTGAISATVWKNEGKSDDGTEREFSTVSLERRYKDKEGNWQSTSSLRVTDLPKVALVANKAFEYLVMKEDATA